jgi:hypothetical protein
MKTANSAPKPTAVPKVSAEKPRNPYVLVLIDGDGYIVSRRELYADYIG